MTLVQSCLHPQVQVTGTRRPKRHMLTAMGRNRSVRQCSSTCQKGSVRHPWQTSKGVHWHILTPTSPQDPCGRVHLALRLLLLLRQLRLQLWLLLWLLHRLHMLLLMLYLLLLLLLLHLLLLDLRLWLLPSSSWRSRRCSWHCGCSVGAPTCCRGGVLVCQCSQLHQVLLQGVIPPGKGMGG